MDSRDIGKRAVSYVSIVAVLVAIVFVQGCDRKGTTGEAADERIVGVWQRMADGQTFVAKFTKTGGVVLKQTGRSDGVQPERVGKFALSNGKLRIIGKQGDQPWGGQTSQVEFLNDGVIAIGNVSADEFHDLAGTWQKVRDSDVAMLEYMGSISGEWRRTDTDQSVKCTVTRGAIFFGKLSWPCTIDAAKKEIAARSPDGPVIGRLTDSGELLFVLDGGKGTMTFRRMKWGEDVVWPSPTAESPAAEPQGSRGGSQGWPAARDTAEQLRAAKSAAETMRRSGRTKEDRDAAAAAAEMLRAAQRQGSKGGSPAWPTAGDTAEQLRAAKSTAETMRRSARTKEERDAADAAAELIRAAERLNE